MTRNQIIKQVGDLHMTAVRRANSLDVDGAETPGAWACVGELERFGNDLCNAPTKHNRERRAITYTVKMAVKKLAELRRR